MIKTCTISGVSFEVSPSELAHYEKLDVPPPTLCPQERMRRRLAFRNEFSLYSRKCDLSGRNIFSMFHEAVPFPVYSNPEWWSDRWDPKKYGVSFDFSKTFLDNLYLLYLSVPRPSQGVVYETMQNSDYCNQAGNLKDCFLVVNADFSERCLYGKGVNRCYDCVDCFKIYDCEACYECLNLNNCKFCSYLSNSHNCYECHFGENLIGCQDCFGCVNLRNQKYCFFNEALSAEDYKKNVAHMFSSFSRAEIQEKLLSFRKRYPVKWMQEINTENCIGDYLVNSKDCSYCFDCEDLERCSYCSDLKKGDGVSFGNYDVSFFGVGVTECYESAVIGYGANRVFFSYDIYGGSDVYYSIYCMSNSQHLFGCIGLRKAEYCILNKQYEKKEYFLLRDKIISHMKDTGEWGEFFSPKLCGFGYNESVANEYFPLTKEEALKLGYSWRDEVPADYQPSKFVIPERIEDVGDEILGEILACKTTGRNYKLQKAELAFYRKMKLPIPTLCPQERHKKRVASRNPRKLLTRPCAECGQEVTTTINEHTSSKVLCETDYLKLFS